MDRLLVRAKAAKGREGREEQQQHFFFCYSSRLFAIFAPFA